MVLHSGEVTIVVTGEEHAVSLAMSSHSVRLKHKEADELGEALMHGRTRSDGFTAADMSAAIREAWRVAITLANNICVQECDRENDNDGDLGWINGTNECARRIREYVEPSDTQLSEMCNEASASIAAKALGANLCHDGERE